MPQPSLNDRVRLISAAPTLWLQCGDEGVVRSVWSSRPCFYEVEFAKPGESFAVRALINAEQLDVSQAWHSDLKFHQEHL
jgi:hypothetical protein